MTHVNSRLSQAFILIALVSLSACSGLVDTENYHRIARYSLEKMKSLNPAASLTYIDRSKNPTTPLVQLRCQRSLIVKSLAIHPWFLIYDPRTDRWDKWDVYAIRGSINEREVHTLKAPTKDGQSLEELNWATQRIGYIDKLENKLFNPDEGIVLTEWSGPEARKIIDVLNQPESYPYKELYRYWPGPNSNTYVAWTLKQARVPYDMHPLAVGKDYLGPWNFGLGTSTTQSGLQIETPIVGLKAGIADGIELHILTLTFGIDLFPPAIKTPLGRYGVQE